MKDHKLCKLEETSKHITSSLYNEYVPLSLRNKDNENHVHPNESVSLDADSRDMNIVEVKGKSFIIAVLT